MSNRIATFYARLAHPLSFATIQSEVNSAMLLGLRPILLRVAMTASSVNSMVVAPTRSVKATATRMTAAATLSANTLETKQSLSAVLFDIDGTLVNSDPVHYSVFQELLLKEDGFNDNNPIDEEFFRQKIAGRANVLIMNDLFPDWTLAQQEEWSIAKEARFRQVASTNMMDLKMNGLDQLQSWIDKNGLQKAAVTNAPRLNAEAILTGIGYNTWFTQDTLIIGDECEKPKPDPCPYLTACKVLNVAPEECVVVEDSPSGARAGVAAGAFVIGILSGQERSTLENAGCHLIINDFSDPKLWQHLEKGCQITSTTTTQP